MSKLIKGVSSIIIILVTCWGGMVITDYQCSQQVKTPIFARQIQVTDCDMYKGLGYTITIRYNGPVGAAGEQPKGYFTWN